MAIKGEGFAREYSERYGKPFREILSEWYWVEGLTQSDIADRIGTATSYISRLFTKYRIARRKKNYWCYGAPAIFQIKIGGSIHDVTGKWKKNGYIILSIPSHPKSGKDKCVFEHRVVKEKEIGRYLNDSEIVHHVNEIKDDNRPENLTVMDRGKHTTLHHIGSKRSEDMRNKVSENAKKRLKNKTNHPSYKNVDDEIRKMVTNGKKPTEIARELQINRKTVYNKINYLGLKEMYKHA